MKKVLFLLLGCLTILACRSGKIAPQPLSTQPFTAGAVVANLPDEGMTASTDTLLPTANAAQISDWQPVAANVSKIQKPTRSALRKNIKAARQWIKSAPADSTELYKRRRMPDIRPVYKVANVSMWLGIGSFALLFLSSLGGIFGLLAVLAAIGALVTGIVALSDLQRLSDQYRGKGRAIAGIVLGSTFLFLLIAAIVLIAIIFANW